MNKVTYEEFMAFDPCWTEEDVKAIYDEYPGGMTALDILRREDVSAEDKLWAVLRGSLSPRRYCMSLSCRL